MPSYHMQHVRAETHTVETHTLARQWQFWRPSSRSLAATTSASPSTIPQSTPRSSRVIPRHPRNCCRSFSRASSLVGSSFPWSRAMRIIKVPTWDPQSFGRCWKVKITEMEPQVVHAHKNTYKIYEKMAGDRCGPI